MTLTSQVVQKAWVSSRTKAFHRFVTRLKDKSGYFSQEFWSLQTARAMLLQILNQAVLSSKIGVLVGVVSGISSHSSTANECMCTANECIILWISNLSTNFRKNEDKSSSKAGKAKIFMSKQRLPPLIPCIPCSGPFCLFLQPLFDCEIVSIIA